MTRPIMIAIALSMLVGVAGAQSLMRASFDDQSDMNIGFADPGVLRQFATPGNGCFHLDTDKQCSGVA